MCLSGRCYGGDTAAMEAWVLQQCGAVMAEALDVAAAAAGLQQCAGMAATGNLAAEAMAMQRWQQQQQLKQQQHCWRRQ